MRSIIDETGRFKGLIRPVAIALGCVTLLFIAYEVVERLWLQNLPREMTNALHIARGGIASLTAAILAGWIVLHRPPPLFSTEISTGERSSGIYLTEEQRIGQYARWFILMRWLAVATAVALIVFAVKIAELLPPEVWWPLLGTIGALAALNVTYTMLLRRGPIGRWILPAQSYGDLLILTVLLHFAGGLENPLTWLMPFHIIIAGILLSRRQCYGVAGFATVLILGLAWLESTEVLAHYTIRLYPHPEDETEIIHAALDPLFVTSRTAVQVIILALTAYFVTTLTDRLRHDERELKAFAQRAHAEGQLLERALETTGTALCVFNNHLEPHQENRRWRTWFGPGGATSGPDSPARKTLADGSVRVTEIAAVLPSPKSTDGDMRDEKRILQLTTAPLIDTEGCISHVVAIAQDVTEQKRAHERILAASRLATAGELAGRVAHEVNNPIAVISAKARLLVSDHRSAMSEYIVQELVKIAELSDRVADVARGLLACCRPVAGPRTLLDLRLPIRRALSMIEGTARTSGVAVHDELPSDLPLVCANAAEMEQVFVNLFVNAVDAMSPGGTLRVGALLRPPATLEVTVADTGTGIAEDIRARIFEPFVTTKPEGKGTGLGLSICQGLVQSHDGDIRVISRLGKGTTFVVNLPIGRKS